MDRDEAIRRHMRSVYDDIWEHFDRTRYRPWPEVLDFIAGSEGDLAVDLASGNGRHAPALAEAGFRTVCIDLCRPLLLSARKRVDGLGRAVHLVMGDVTGIPLKDGSADVFLFIAGLHHLPTPGERVSALTEARRVLRAGGRGLISVWSVGQTRVPEERMSLHAETLWGTIELEGNDRFIPWSGGGIRRERYYHLFSRGEFADLVGTVFERSETFTSGDNHFSVVVV